MKKIEKDYPFSPSTDNEAKLFNMLAELIDWQHEMLDWVKLTELWSDERVDYNLDKLEARIESLEKKVGHPLIAVFGDDMNVGTKESPIITCPQCLNENLKGLHTKSVSCKYYEKQENEINVEASWYETFKASQAVLGTIKQEKWQPEEDQLFFYITMSGVVYQGHYAPSDAYTDKMLHDFGNCFKTKEEAEAMRDRIKSLLEAR